ncbi:MAG TPA: glycine zipper 2TM domain-containing protein [Steroidobacteraceae bacterium]|nr:glycine zipper 2TM domain-containing protein [Steroidobacteraceae bacterium]
MKPTPHIVKFSLFVALIAALGLNGCVGPGGPMRYETSYEQPRVPNTQILFYPAAGQSPEQQARDRYECYQWAVKQTGFDPSQLSLAPHQRIDVEPAVPAGHDTATGAITGAIIGAAVSNPRHAGGGAILGAIAGAAMGAANDSARQERADRLQHRFDAREGQHQAAIEEQADSYRRAMTACIEGRGYTVSDH